MVDASIRGTFWWVPMLRREDTVALQAVSEMSGERNKVEASLVESAVNNVVAHVGQSELVKV
jgi:hypothetical protein